MANSTSAGDFSGSYQVVAGRVEAHQPTKSPRREAAETVERELRICQRLRQRIADTKAATTKADHLLLGETRAIGIELQRALKKAHDELIELLAQHGAKLRDAQLLLQCHEGGVQ